MFVRITSGWSRSTRVRQRWILTWRSRSEGEYGEGGDIRTDVASGWRATRGDRVHKHTQTSCWSHIAPNRRALQGATKTVHATLHPCNASTCLLFPKCRLQFMHKRRDGLQIHRSGVACQTTDIYCGNICHHLMRLHPTASKQTANGLCGSRLFKTEGDRSVHGTRTVLD